MKLVFEVYRVGNGWFIKEKESDKGHVADAIPVALDILRDLMNDEAKKPEEDGRKWSQPEW